MATPTQQIVIEIVTKQSEQLTKLTQQLTEMQESSTKAGDSISGTTSKLANIGLVGEGIKSIAASFADLFAPLKGIDDAVFGLTHSGIKNIDELRNAINSIQGSTIIDTAAGLEAAGKALDSGFIAQTDGVADLTEATMLLDRAGKLAAITGADVGNVAQTTAEMMNALQLNASHLPDVMDTLSFAAAETNFGLTDMMASMKQIAPVATGAGLGLNELAATYITLGRNGQEMGQIQSSIQMLLNQMQRPTAELQTVMERAGVSMQSLASDGLATTFQKINVALNETGTTAGEVFGGRVEGTFRRLVENADEVKTELEAINKDAAGSLDSVYGEFTQTMEGKTQSMKQHINALLESMLAPLKDIAPTLTSISSIMPAISGVWGAISVSASGVAAAVRAIKDGTLAGYATSVKELAIRTKTRAVALATSAAKKFDSMHDKLAVVIQRERLALELKNTAAVGARNVLQRAGNALQLAFNVIASANPIGLIVAGAAALVGTMILLYNKCEPFKNLVDYIWERIKTFGGIVYKNLIEPIGKLLGLVDKKTAPLKSRDTTDLNANNSNRQGAEVVQPTADLTKVIGGNTQAIKSNTQAVEDNKRKASEALKKKSELWKAVTDTVNKAREAAAGVRERIFLYNATEDEKELYEFDKKLKTELESMNALHASLLKDRVALTAGELEKLSGMGVDVAVLADPAAVAAQAAELQEAINLAVEQGAKERAAMEIEQGRKAAAAVLSAARGQLEKARKIEDIKINLIPDVPLREFEQAKAVLARHLADAQEEWAGNNEVLQLLQQAHDREMLALVDEFYRAKAAKDAAAFDDYVSIVQAGFSSNIGDIMAKNADVAGSLGDLQAEEDALRTSYNKRKIDFQELQDKLLEISKKRAEAEKQIDRNAFSTAYFGQLAAMAGQFAEQSASKLQATLSSIPALKAQSAGLGGELDANEIALQEVWNRMAIESDAAKYAELELLESEHLAKSEQLKAAAAAKDEEIAAAQKAAWAQAGVSLVSSMGASYAKLKAEGASTQKALVASALGGLKAQIPIYAAQIIGKAFSINPLLGVASIVALPLLYAALSKAEAAVGAAKFFTGGVVEASNSAERGRDKVPIWANHGEGILPNWLMEAGDTKAALLWSLRQHKSFADYYRQPESQLFRGVIRMENRRAEAKTARAMAGVNESLVRMHRMQEVQFAGMQQELARANDRLERLEYADFNKNINIEAHVNTDLKGAFVDVEFRNRVGKGR